MPTYIQRISSPALINWIFINILTWGCFLTLSGAVIGFLNRELKEKMYAAAKLGEELIDHKALLEKTTTELIEYTDTLEEKVAARTSTLEESKQAVETLKDKVEEALYTTMDPSVVKLMIEKRLRTEKRRISILFCDLKGFTEYSQERRAENIINDLNRYLADMEEILINYQAHIDKYMGDGIMVEFGAPIDYGRHTLLMCSGRAENARADQTRRIPLGNAHRYCYRRTDYWFDRQ